MSTNTTNQTPHLMQISTGKILAVTDKVPIVRGIMSGHKDNVITIDEIVLPSDIDPAGKIKFNAQSEGIPSHQSLRPEVVGAVFVSQEWIEQALCDKASSEELETRSQESKETEN